LHALQVFPKEGYTQFYNAMVAKLKAGQPPSIKQTLKVLPNSFLGIAGGYTTNLLWLLNVKDTTWEAALPKDTKKMLENFRKDKGLAAKKDKISTLYASLKDFPYITTFAMDYSPELTQMMSQMASYTVMQSEKEIKSLLAAPPAAAAATAPAAAAKPVAPQTAAKPAAIPATAAAAAARAAASAVAATPQAAVKPAAAVAATATAAAAGAQGSLPGTNSTRG
jgi:hypothetical protein